ncbi:GNAT family N-acetyltransferase [Actinoplanes sp. Pm04-4]|uniref:GNAT family N-acetyltransferase n=1 Tax=Paractinoplanes pyxinae TaxID=2997416 RepID=A0ABT4ARE9_9ACTN|nr:GNAT family N-acetyltransferase [Actinoplanes pyxinae]MCY1136801.1 GNAT family N-acetyltransferase [Actinoplanes pyxinae]
MSDLLTPATAADAAAEAAGIHIRPLTELAELRDLYELFDSIWHFNPANPPVTRDLLRAMSKAGNYVVGVFDASGMIGGCVAFFAAPDRREMHSHIAGVTRAAQSRSVGRALKLHQRAWALSRGVTRVSWTYDPLVSRNAYFNLVKLGALPVQYLPDFYGAMGDSMNRGDDTDRLLVHWELNSPYVDQAAHGGRPEPRDLTGAVVVLDRTPDGEPAPRPAEGRTVLVAVPPDIGLLRRADPASARRWRVAVREALAPLMDSGARVTGFDRAGWYVVDREDR